MRERLFHASASDFLSHTRGPATFSRVCWRLLKPLATFRARRAREDTGEIEFQKTGPKKIAKNSGTRSGPASMQAGGRRFLYSGPGVYVQRVT